MIENIDIDIDNIDEYLNDYDDDKIDDELVDYIMESIDDLNKDITFNVNFKYKDNENKIDKVKDKINFTFKELRDDNEIRLKRSTYRIIVLLVLGILLFWVSNLLKGFDLNTFSEIMKVLCWFSITYVGQEVIFNRRKLVRIKKKYDKVINAKINVKSN